MTTQERHPNTVDSANDLSQPHFEGLWITDITQIEERWQQGANHWPKAILFLGNCLMLVMSLDPPKSADGPPSTSFDLWRYVVTPRIIHFVAELEDPPTGYDSAWRTRDGYMLEIQTEEAWFRYEPATWDRVIELGFDEDAVVDAVARAKRIPLSFNTAPRFPNFKFKTAP